MTEIFFFATVVASVSCGGPTFRAQRPSVQAKKQNLGQENKKEKITFCKKNDFGLDIAWVKCSVRLICPEGYLMNIIKTKGCCCEREVKLKLSLDL